MGKVKDWWRWVEDLEGATEIHFLPVEEKRASRGGQKKTQARGEVYLPLDPMGTDGLDLRSVGRLVQPIRAQVCPHTGLPLWLETIAGHC